jgi:uncharacterized protein
MTHRAARPAAIVAILAAVALAGGAVASPAGSTVKARLLAHLAAVKVVDCHEHQRVSPEYVGRTHNFYTILSYSYLQYDLISAGARAPTAEQINVGDLDALWDGWGRSLDTARATTYYRQLLLGYRRLYGYRGDRFTREGIRDLSARIAANYRDEDAWFERAFRQAGFDVMFVDKWWNNYDTDLRSPHFALVFNIGDLVRGAGERPPAGSPAPERGPYGRAARAGRSIATLGDYVAFVDEEFQRFADHGVVAVKNATAYWRSLDFRDVPRAEADALFARPSTSLSADEKKALQDFVFHSIVKASIRRHVPIQIHTGYQSGNGNVLENSQPLKLTNLFQAYPEARFVLFHGGLPWTREAALLAKMFPNVSLDLVWLPQLSRQAAIQSVDEMLDLVPYTKFFWGGDSHFIEESAGSLEIAKDVVAEVLANRVTRGLLSEPLAREIATAIFRTNARTYFRL